MPPESNPLIEAHHENQLSAFQILIQGVKKWLDLDEKFDQHVRGIVNLSGEEEESTYNSIQEAKEQVRNYIKECGY